MSHSLYISFSYTLHHECIFSVIRMFQSFAKTHSTQTSEIHLSGILTYFKNAARDSIRHWKISVASLRSEDKEWGPLQKTLCIFISANMTASTCCGYFTQTTDQFQEVQEIYFPVFLSANKTLQKKLYFNECTEKHWGNILRAKVQFINVYFIKCMLSHNITMTLIYNGTLIIVPLYHDSSNMSILCR